MASNRALATAGVPLIERALDEHIVGAPLAGRADDAIGPAQPEEDRATQLLSAVELMEFGLRQAFLELHLVASHRLPSLRSLGKISVSCGVNAI